MKRIQQSKTILIELMYLQIEEIVIDNLNIQLTQVLHLYVI